MMWGQITAIVYGYIRDNYYLQAVKILEEQLQHYPESHAALSLLGYCHYFLGDYHAAASMYEQLTRLRPTHQMYKAYQAQSLYKAGMLGEAAKVSLSIDGNQKYVVDLQACICYEQGDIAGSKMISEQNKDNNMDAVVNLGCCLYKEANYSEALTQFIDASNALGFQPELAYNKALCFYKLDLFGQALKTLADIFEHGAKEHPEFNVGTYVEGSELRSVGNSPNLKESVLIEAFNLKASIEFVVGNIDGAKQALQDMPPRAEEELDSITLHNQGLMNMDTDPTSGFRKLNFLLKNPPFPPETFGNLLLLYCKPAHGFFDLAADLMAENIDLTFKHLSQDLYEFLEATILTQTSVEEAYQKFNELANRHGEFLRRCTKQIQDARISKDVGAHRKAILEHKKTLERYIPILMAMAKIHWDKENYAQVERIFHQCADICCEHDTWKLNVAHTFFMQDTRYKEAIHYYEPIVNNAGENVLSVPAIVLANLCVSYIMTNRNEEAEDLMRKVEKEEERATYEKPNKQNLHLCIINLVIGTLYSTKQNFEFGISRIIKSLEPYEKKIEIDTWFYAKRCFLAIFDNLSKQMLMLKDTTISDIDEFLDAAETYGKNIVTQYTSIVNPSTILGRPDTFIASPTQSPSVREEARLLKRMFLKLRD